VVNLTPDSFSDGGRLANVDSAVEFALRLQHAGADVLDLGGESTRPQRAEPISAAEEIDRVVPVISGLAKRASVPISIDTTKAAVAAAALEAGADIVNDISGGLFDDGMIDAVARAGAAYVCGHVRGGSIAQVHASESDPPTFEDVSLELARRLAALPVDLRQRTLVDPGLGFGKKGRENLELLARSGELAAALARPVLVGPSRKRFLGDLTGRPVDDRDHATIGAGLAAVAAGADALRVHDVKGMRDALTVFEAVRGRA
jgi:dihydropteroate synthase